MRYLDVLGQKELVFNSDIPELLKRRLDEIEAEKRRIAELRLLDIPAATPGLDHLKFPNRAALHERFKEFPEQQISLEGAVDAFLGNAPDAYRHAVTGARVAFEGLALKITGSGKDWKEEIRRIADRETAALFTAAYKFLSSRGPHPGRTPTKHDAETAIKSAITLMDWLLAHRDRFTPAPGMGVPGGASRSDP